MTNKTDAVKATKVTIMSILFAPAPVLTLPEGQEVATKEETAAHKVNVAEFVAEQSKKLAGYLVNKSTDLDLILAILKGSVKAVPAVLTEIEAEKAKELAEREAEAKKQADAKLAADKAQEEADAALQKEVMEGLLKVMSKEQAEAFVLAGISATKKKTATSNGKSYDRVNLTVGEKSFDVPVRGNMSQEVKDLIAAEFGSVEGARDLFIAKYRTTPAEQAETEQPA